MQRKVVLSKEGKSDECCVKYINLVERLFNMAMTTKPKIGHSFGLSATVISVNFAACTGRCDTIIFYGIKFGVEDTTCVQRDEHIFHNAEKKSRGSCSGRPQ